MTGFGVPVVSTEECNVSLSYGMEDDRLGLTIRAATHVHRDGVFSDNHGDYDSDRRSVSPMFSSRLAGNCGRFYARRERERHTGSGALAAQTKDRKGYWGARWDRSEQEEIGARVRLVRRVLCAGLVKAERGMLPRLGCEKRRARGGEVTECTGKLMNPRLTRCCTEKKRATRVRVSGERAYKRVQGEEEERRVRVYLQICTNPERPPKKV